MVITESVVYTLKGRSPPPPRRIVRHREEPERSHLLTQFSEVLAADNPADARMISRHVIDELDVALKDFSTTRNVTQESFE